MRQRTPWRAFAGAGAGAVIACAAVAYAVPSSVPTLLGDAEQHRAGQVSYAVAAADLDLDGIVDLVVANNESNDVSVLPGAGGGSFRTGRFYAVDAGPSAVGVADMNGDELPDVVVAHDAASSVLTLLQTPGIPLDFHAALPSAAGDGPEAMVIADFDGDRVPDVATANLFSADGTVSVLLGLGDGRLAAAVHYPTVAAGSDFIAAPCAIAAADVDGNDTMDLLVANVDGDNLALLRGAGDGTFSAATNFAVGPAPVAVAAGDLNLDGFVDAVTANEEDGTITLLFGDGAGGFDAFGFDVDLDSFPTAVAIADLNLDLRPDVIVAASGSEADGVIVLRGIGASTPGGFAFEAVEDFPIDLAAPNPFGLAVADLDGDQKPDVATANVDVADAADAVSVFLNESPRYRNTGDCNGDGEVEIVELQRCVYVSFFGGPFDSCPACGGGDSEVSVTDLQGAVNCFLDSSAPSCPYFEP